MNDAHLVHLVDGLEDSADGYVTLAQVEAAAGHQVSDPIARGLLLVDYRTRLDGTPVTLCRLNRHHPLVAQLTGW
ncbi:MAG: hypothetical protein ACR2IK_23685 [Chloroflexota bacterium]